jgi:hypothetical protein
VEAMSDRDEVRAFLQSRRARITPEQAGVETFGGRRRVEGLRRLERGNLRGVSEPVLQAVARALQLDQAEIDHLFNLARAASSSARRPRRRTAESVRPALQYMLDVIVDAPALIRNYRMDMVAANTLGWALHSEMLDGPSGVVNHTRFIFLDPRARSFFQDWSLHADTNVALLRRDSARVPGDRRLESLIREMTDLSDEFRVRWASHDVRRHYTGVKQYHHPAVGDLDLTYQSLEFEEDPGLVLTILPAVPGSASAERLRLLASWAATEHIDERARATLSR